MLQISTPGGDHFYAIFVPRESPSSEKVADETSESPLVFREMKEALEAIKKYKDKSPRFKNFSHYDEAVRYCRDGDAIDLNSSSDVSNGDCSAPRPSTPRPVTPAAAEELPRPFPAPSAPELTKFRKAIEAKQIDKVIELIDCNPRYLINCNGDTPTILHAGCRYNALHVAARIGHLEMIKVVLELFTDANSTYVRRLYPDDKNDETTSNRRRVLLDFYLNTPDYGFNETPLHFAAKNGHVNIVEYLCSFLECQRSLINKSGQTAKDSVIESERVGQKTKSEIIRLLDYGVPAFYIPLYRARDEANAPILLHPRDGFPERQLQAGRDKDSLTMDYKLAAYIGPVDADVADKLHSQWASNQCTPTKASKGKKKSAKTSQSTPVPSNPAAVKRSDLHKGMERVGRRVAASGDHPWLEYWHFLGAFVDLRSENGLKLLERYFCEKANGDTNNIQDLVTSKLKETSGKDWCRKKLDFSDDEKDNDSSRDSADLYFDATDDHCQTALADGRSVWSCNADETRDGYLTPPQELTANVIVGQTPTKLDLDVFAALESVKIDENRFPRTAAWLKMVGEYTDEERRRWLPLDSPRSATAMKKSLVHNLRPSVKL